MDEDSFGIMSGYALTATARRDLKSIWQYIATDSMHYADLVEEAVLETCRLAVRNPTLGHRRHEIADPRVFFLAVQDYKRYSIVYLAGSEPLQIVRVIHGARDIPRLLQSDR